MHKRRYLAGKIAPGSPRFARLQAKYGPLPSQEAKVEAPKPVVEAVEEAPEEEKPVKPKKKTKKVAKKKSEK